MNQTIIGIDYGTERIGVAHAQGPLAEPLRIFSGKKEKWGQLIDLILDEHIQDVVLGLSENTMAEKTKAFAEYLSERTGVTIHFIDETLSSQAMRNQLKSSKAMKASKTRGPIDHFVAATLLQEWLDDHPDYFRQ